MSEPIKPPERSNINLKHPVLQSIRHDATHLPRRVVTVDALLEAFDCHPDELPERLMSFCVAVGLDSDDVDDEHVVFTRAKAKVKK